MNHHKKEIEFVCRKNSCKTFFFLRTVKAELEHIHVYSNLILLLLDSSECKYRQLIQQNLFFFSYFISVTGSPSSMPHMPYEKSKMIDITRDKPIKVSVRVVVPTKDHPKVRKKKEKRDEN